MLKDVKHVRHVGGYRLWLEFEDGVSGEVDISDMVDFHGVFAPLRDPVEFAKVRVEAEAGTIVWPNGADLDPDVLCAAVVGEPIDLRGAA